MTDIKRSLKPRKEYDCPICGNKFVKMRIGQKVCQRGQCALKFVRQEKARKEEKEIRKALKARKAALKPYNDHVKATQKVFNEYIRLRDADFPCISCGRHHEGQYHAGHFKTTAARPDLRFNEDNVHRQCQPCNLYLSGNIDKYRPALIGKIGLKRVEALEVVPKPHRPSVEELKGIREFYRHKIKQLKEVRAAA
ncbi:bacteriophage lambda NinG family protein [Leminorella grimontii]|uniref:Bacteriophage lambda NinG family protein n=1 Tax=Leminorella grimontii TaxID=82981 RepID=A0AAV5MW67_9GAMM|nr:recombination protein NinG [Leminorella grimontii]GKX54081.1 bacteriophage lambda NinG family protein [Leminorella grimontii]VFS60126.1 Bacteriophage Lambda NinG protein [Leminorella grimontii]